jgi:5-methyltetrahydrofolate corrinoid/iron sulfur protein methyltransferase
MLLIADNLQITRRDVAEAIHAHHADRLQSKVKELQTAGAQAIDLNVGPLGRNAEEDMAFCVTAVQAVTDLPILIDTANPLAMQAGLAANRKKAIVNGISLEPEKLERILPLAIEYGVAAVGYLLDRRSHVPRRLDDRLAIALELYQHCRSAGLPAEQLIFDPVVAPLMWQDGLQRNRDLLEIIRRLPEVLDHPVRTIVGLSNLTTGQGPSAAKRRLEQAFLCMLSSSGLSWVMLDIHHRETVQTALNCRLLLEERVFAWQTVAV